MAWIEDTVFGKQDVAQRMENDELRGRLHGAEQTIMAQQVTIMAYQAELDAHREALRPFAEAGKCFRPGDIERGNSIAWFVHTDRCAPIFNLKPVNFANATKLLQGATNEPTE